MKQVLPLATQSQFEHTRRPLLKLFRTRKTRMENRVITSHGTYVKNDMHNNIFHWLVLPSFYNCIMNRFYIQQNTHSISLCFPGDITVGELLRNKTAFVLDVLHHMDFDSAALYLLMETTLPKKNLEVSRGHPQVVCKPRGAKPMLAELYILQHTCIHLFRWVVPSSGEVLQHFVT